MADVFSKKKRSIVMAGIRSKNTRAEIYIRKSLHALGYRYKVHDKGLPGRPDIVLPKYKAVIQVNGCFWHKHTCSLFKWPSSNKDFWRTKILNNKRRDVANKKKILSSGWRLLVIWECSLKRKNKIHQQKVIEIAEQWLESNSFFKEIGGPER